MPNQTHRSKTFQFLKEHAGKFFSALELAAGTSQKEQNVRVHVSDLLRNKRISRLVISIDGKMQNQVKYGIEKLENKEGEINE